MTVTLTYDDEAARVHIAANELAAADHALIERSTDQVRWTAVRGGVEVPVVAGALDVDVYDYEFAADVTNYYRVRGISTDPITFVAAGTASVGADGSRTPGEPAGIAAGDLLLCLASTRNSGTGTVDTPDEWDELAVSGNVALLGRVYDGSEAMPTITFTGGAANATTLAQICAFRNAGLWPSVAAAVQLNSSAQNIAHPALTVPDDDQLVVVCGWKQDDWTSVATLAGMSEIGEPDSADGDDAGQVWDYQIQTTAASIGAGAFAVTGGAGAISRAIVTAFTHAEFLNEQSASIEPELPRIWLKAIPRAFLNLPVTVVDFSELSREARGADHAVVGRTLPISTTDVSGSRRYTLVLYTSTVGQRQHMDFLIASGDIVLVHTPAGCEVPGGYYRIDGASYRRTVNYQPKRLFLLPLVETAAPGPDIVYAHATWDTILAAYDGWPAIMADFTSWDEIYAELFGAPDEVIVP